MCLDAGWWLVSTLNDYKSLRPLYESKNRIKIKQLSAELKALLPGVRSEVLINWDKSLMLRNRSFLISEYLVQTKKTNIYAAMTTDNFHLSQEMFENTKGVIKGVFKG